MDEVGQLDWVFFFFLCQKVSKLKRGIIYTQPAMNSFIFSEGKFSLRLKFVLVKFWMLTFSAFFLEFHIPTEQRALSSEIHS